MRPKRWARRRWRAAEAAAEEQRWLRLEAETHDKALREELEGEVDRLEQLRNEADSAAEAVVEVEAQLVDSYAEGQAVVAQADAAWRRTSSKRVGLLADTAELVELHCRKQRSSHRPCPHRSRAGLRVHGG